MSSGEGEQDESTECVYSPESHHADFSPGPQRPVPVIRQTLLRRPDQKVGHQCRPKTRSPV